MPAITTSATREIIDDFAQEIQHRLTKTPKPSMEVINFRNETKEKRERPIVSVPIEILRYRKNNGRIASDVLDHERNVGMLDEKDELSQETIRDFLEKKDP